MSQDAVEPTVTTQRAPWSRRRWVAWGLAAAGAACLVDAVFVEPYWVEFVERDLPIEHLPAGLEGKTLVQLSDLHVGPRVSESYLLQSFARVEQLQPELVVITGDFVTSYGLIPGQAQVERVLAKNFPRDAWERSASLEITTTAPAGIAASCRTNWACY